MAWKWASSLEFSNPVGLELPYMLQQRLIYSWSAYSHSAFLSTTIPKVSPALLITAIGCTKFPDKEVAEPMLDSCELSGVDCGYVD